MNFLDSPYRINLITNPYECNLNCIMCDEHSPSNLKSRKKTSNRCPILFMDYKVIQSLFNDYKHLNFKEIVTSAMGEPLLYRHIDNIIDFCEKSKTLLHITTNGTFPKQGVEFWSKKLTAIGANIKISLNGANDDTQAKIMPGADLNRVINNIKKLVKIRDETVSQGGLKSLITLKITFMESNFHEIPEIINLAYSLGVDRIRGSHLMSLFPQLDHECLNRSEKSKQRFNEMMLKVKQMIKNLENISDKKIILSNFIPLNNHYHIGDCPYAGKEAWINEQGNLISCCLPEKVRPKHMTFGNILKNGLLSMWKSSSYYDFCKNYKKYPECINCSKRSIDYQED